MELTNEIELVEAVLFLESDPVEMKTLVKITDLPKEIIEQAIEKLEEKYSSAGSGLELIQFAGGYTLSPKQHLWDFLKERYGQKNDKRLSRAAMETLSIIAYSQPITKAEIENIRGVSADNMIRMLLDRNLIKHVGKKDIPGKPVLFGTTKDFLKIFGLNSISDLPKLDDVQQVRFELNG
ncbi:MAG: SMC-Scp complex subunit ScpB [Spirochaetales bacterium]|uniref:SMC-Scp complex subunit ScpB n=1 Tax=Candidatus Thalassospirochaeta sargassi TaxID=3119039 RepID=A0AAJ1MLP2_9SPIO|nr:SMC-Scp complex subunit ScpB [Spirochaetales bacterium]